jgi:hypothetical protein
MIVSLHSQDVATEDIDYAITEYFRLSQPGPPTTLLVENEASYFRYCTIVGEPDIDDSTQDDMVEMKLCQDSTSKIIALVRRKCM